MSDHLAFLSMAATGGTLVALKELPEPHQHGPFVEATFRDAAGEEWTETSNDLMVIKNWYAQAGR